MRPKSRKGRVWLAAAAAAALGVAAAAGADAPRAGGGRGLVAGIEADAPIVVASVVRVEVLDASAYRATLLVETRVGRTAEDEGLAARAPGDEAPIELAWEELATSRAPRLAAKERVLVVLAPLPGASIWLDRIPDPAQRARTRTIAARGEAFLRAPSSGSVDRLQHYAAMSREARAGEPGASVLAQLVAGAEPPLAIEATVRLNARSDLAAQLSTATAKLLVKGLLRGDSRALEAALLALFDTQPLESARPSLEALAEGTPRPPAAVYAALASLNGGLAPARARELLADAPAEHRRVAARTARGEESDALLRQLARSDPDPEVRAAALMRLAELDEAGAEEPLLRGLGDPSAAVRRASVRALAQRGDAVLPTLRQVVDGNDPRSAQSALVAISLMQSRDARTTMGEIAEQHPDPGLRKLAAIALGQKSEHAH